MIKARYISFEKLALIIFSALLPVNFLAMVFVGWNDQGTMTDGFLVSVGRVIVNIILFPLHVVENLFRMEPFAGTFFFIGDVICLALWALLLASVYKFIQKKTRKPVSKKRG